MTNYSADKLRDRNIETMGVDLGTVFSALYQHVGNVHIKWNEYKELFGTSPERIDLLNRAAASFFGMIQHTLLKEVLLNICQLTDPPDSIGKPNLTILRLPSLIADVALKSAVESEIAGAQDKSEFCRDWRNRHIAHLDFDLALGINAKPFKDATRAKVTEALAAIAATLNKVEEAINHGTLNFVIFKPIHGAHSLLHIIDDGLKAGQERETRLSQGKWLPSDTQSKI